MKLTKQKLKQIIKEELDLYLKESLLEEGEMTDALKAGAKAIARKLARSEVAQIAAAMGILTSPIMLLIMADSVLADSFSADMSNPGSAAVQVAEYLNDLEEEDRNALDDAFADVWELHDDGDRLPVRLSTGTQYITLSPGDVAGLKDAVEHYESRSGWDAIFKGSAGHYIPGGAAHADTVHPFGYTRTIQHQKKKFPKK
jgi:hypothetical protein